MEYEEALNVILAEADPIREMERVSLPEAVGRILGEDIRAPFDVPHFPKSAMDGYAVRAEDVKAASADSPVRLRVVGEMLAGDTVPGASDGEKTAPGADDQECVVGAPLTAVRIMTGAMVPDGYDAVVRQEDTDYGEKEVSVFQGVKPYMNYCRVGEDIEKDSVVLPAGQRIGRIEAGVLASLGIAELSVLRKIRVSLISTGSELCELPDQRTGVTEKTSMIAGLTDTGSVRVENRTAEEQECGESADARIPEAGRIYNSIAYTLAAALSESAFSFEHSICPDDAEAIAERIEQALRTSDVVITTGGVSVGKKDLLPEVLEQIGAEKCFSGVNIQPGTPTIGSVRDGKAILSLSGNPYAALVNFDLYFKPLSAMLTGCNAFLPVTEEAILQSEYPKVNRQRRFIRARAENGKVYLPAKSHASSVLSNLLDCNCYIDLPQETAVQPGDVVRIIRF